MPSICEDDFDLSACILKCFIILFCLYGRALSGEKDQFGLRNRHRKEFKRDECLRKIRFYSASRNWFKPILWSFYNIVHNKCFCCAAGEGFEIWADMTSGREIDKIILIKSFVLYRWNIFRMVRNVEEPRFMNFLAV